MSRVKAKTKDECKLSSKKILSLYSLNVMIRKGDGVSGSDISREVLGSISNTERWYPANGTLYPALKDLLDKGYIIEEPTDDYKTKAYSITKEGVLYYQENLEFFRTYLLESVSFYNNLLQGVVKGNEVEKTLKNKSFERQ